MSLYENKETFHFVPKSMQLENAIKVNYVQKEARTTQKRCLLFRRQKKIGRKCLFSILVHFVFIYLLYAFLSAEFCVIFMGHWFGCYFRKLFCCSISNNVHLSRPHIGPSEIFKFSFLLEITFFLFVISLKYWSINTFSFGVENSKIFYHISSTIFWSQSQGRSLVSLEIFGASWYPLAL